MLDLLWNTETETPRIEPVLPKLLASPSLDYGAFGLDPEAEGPSEDGRPVGSLVPDDLAAILGAGNPCSTTFKLAFLYLQDNPLRAVRGGDGGLILAAARALAAQSDRLMPDCSRTLQEYMRRQLVRADAAFWEQFGVKARTLGLNEAGRRALRQRFEDGDPGCDDPRFSDECAILERLTEARMRIARQGIQLTACYPWLPARSEGAGTSEMPSGTRNCETLLPTDRPEAAEDTVFAIIPDGERVRVCYFTETRGDCWHGPAFSGIEDALAAAKSVYGVPMTAWTAC